MSNLYWLSEEQMVRLRPFFPKSRGVPRVDDRRVLSGIIFINLNNLRWFDAPKEYAIAPGNRHSAIYQKPCADHQRDKPADDPEHRHKRRGWRFQAVVLCFRLNRLQIGPDKIGDQPAEQNQPGKARHLAEGENRDQQKCRCHHDRRVTPQGRPEGVWLQAK
jgi:transposase